MEDWVVGVLAVAVGLVVALRGYLALRILISVWGAFAGFMLGAGIVDAASDDGFLRHALGWVIGFALALLFGLLAYLYYEVSVFVAMSALGFALGSSVMVAFGVTWTWVIVLVGVITGVFLAFIAIIGDLPTFILVVLTALGGASATVFGLMLLTGDLETESFASPESTEDLVNGWWYALYLVLAVVGMVSQLRSVDQQAASLREEWGQTNPQLGSS